MIDVSKVADNANLIINGYAYTQNGDYIKVLNLNHPDKASMFNLNAELIETNMDDIEIAIVLDYFPVIFC